MTFFQLLTRLSVCVLIPFLLYLWDSSNPWACVGLFVFFALGPVCKYFDIPFTYGDEGTSVVRAFQQGTTIPWTGEGPVDFRRVEND